MVKLKLIWSNEDIDFMRVSDPVPQTDVIIIISIRRMKKHLHVVGLTPNTFTLTLLKTSSEAEVSNSIQDNPSLFHTCASSNYSTCFYFLITHHCECTRR